MAHAKRGLADLAAVCRLAALLVAAALTVAACRRPDAGDVDLRWTLRPERPAVGPATLTLTIGEPHAAVSGTAVHVVGHMAHPGMPPVVATVTPRGRGVYDALLDLNMAGDWMLVVTVQLADGRRVERRISVPNVQTPPA